MNASSTKQHVVHIALHRSWLYTQAVYYTERLDTMGLVFTGLNDVVVLEEGTTFVHGFTGEILMITKSGDTLSTLTQRLDEFKGGHVQFSLIDQGGARITWAKDVCVSGTTISVVFGEMWPEWTPDWLTLDKL
jgi:hypothetical protein